jgi:hypothetical protein
LQHGRARIMVMKTSVTPALPPALKQINGRVVKCGCRLKNERSLS